MTKQGKVIKAVGYLRVSSQGQLSGHGQDRQQDTITCYAKQAGYEIIGYYDDAHTGTEANRPAFTRMLDDLLGNGCKVIVVESLDRLARDLRIQLQLVAFLSSHDLTLINATTGENVTAAMQADPMQRAMIQIQGVFSELDKGLLVRKLRKGREAKRTETGTCEGRKSYGYYEGEPQIIERIKQLYLSLIHI